METVSGFISLGSIITVTSGCSHKIKRLLLLGKKAVTNLDSLRHDFADKGSYCPSTGFQVVMYGCESWTIKKAELRRIDAFELWFWRRLLRGPWTAKRSH